jgi:hypothetical protein
MCMLSLPPCLPALPQGTRVPRCTTLTTLEALAQPSQLEGRCLVHTSSGTCKCTDASHRLHSRFTPNVWTRALWWLP